MTVLATDTARMGRWQARPGFGVYVHIPFCRHRCHYCDFNTYEGLDDLFEAYVDALIADIARWPHEARRATSVFFGGGTPTLLPPSEIGRILAAVDEAFGIDGGAEVTVEANPETVTPSSLRELRATGVARISLGVQSLVAPVLAQLGRTHDAATALGALDAARAAGFDDVNLDLIYGSPWETTEQWATTLQGVVEREPDHISAYALTVEEGTPLHTLVATGRVRDVDPDVQADRHAMTEEVLASAGFVRYEVSNWARPGRASAHNVLYWSAGDYAGFGAGAHGHLEGLRWWNERLPRVFIERVMEEKPTIAGEESLSPDARAGEALMLGLRLRSGIERAGYVARFGSDALDARREGLDRLESDGLLIADADTLRLTERGTMLANEVAARLL